MLTPPDGLSDDALARLLGEGWGVEAVSIDYRAVGFGSHHWEVVDADGIRRFATVDDLDTKRQSLGEPAAAAFGRLRAALATAMELRDSGATFVVAPIATRTGEPLVGRGNRFAVALYPYIDGQQYSWGEFSTPAHRQGILDLIVELHAVPTTVVRHAMADDFTVPHRDELELSYHDDVAWESGPYARRASVLLCQNADKIGRLVARYDDLVSQQRRRPTRNVVTHGEPHPGNTMLTSAGWLLIDWDTVLIAPPERDLWSLDPGDGSAVRAYSEAAGAVVQPLMLELYRIRWDLADMAASASQFRGPHSDSPDDAMSWEVLSTLIEELPA